MSSSSGKEPFSDWEIAQMAEKQKASVHASIPSRRTRKTKIPPENYSTTPLCEVDKVTHLLSGIQLASITPVIDRDLYASKQAPESKTDASSLDLTISTKMACSVCNVNFGTRQEQIQHYKLDWHRFNLKQKLLGCAPVTEETFDDMTECISSLSGTESGSDEDDNSIANTSGGEVASSPSHYSGKPHGIKRSLLQQWERPQNTLTSTDTEYESDEKSPKEKPKVSPRLQPKIYFRNAQDEIVALYRCIVHGKQNVPQSEDELLSRVKDLTSQKMWAIILVGGGHFAAAIFNGANVTQHKTFHRYTVRSKQGTAQSSRDGAQGGHMPKSGGASLRRHNEAMLVKDIQDLLNSWHDQLQLCTHIFYRAPSFNRVALFGGKNPPLKKTDSRLRSIPFPTRRATFTEVQRVQKLLSTVECFGNESLLGGLIPQSPKIHLGTKKSQVTQEEAEVQNVDDVAKNLIHLESTETLDSLPGSAFTEICDVKMNEADVDSEPGEVFDYVCEIPKKVSLKRVHETKKPHLSKHKLSKAREKKTWKRQGDPTHNGFQNDTKHHVRDTLYIACKTGDPVLLQNTLPLLCQKESTLADSMKDSSTVLTENKLPILSSMLDGDKDGMDNPMLLEPGKSTTEKLDSQSIPQVLPQLHLPADNGSQGSWTDEDVVVDKIQSPPSMLASIFTPQSQECDDDTSVNMQVPKLANHPTAQKQFKLRLRSPSSSLKKDDPKTPEVTKDMINEGVGDSGATLLHIAAREGHRDVVKLLLDFGADPTIKDKQGVTPYQTSLDQETRDVFHSFMITHAEKFDYLETQIGRSPLPEEFKKQSEKKRKKTKKENTKHAVAAESKLCKQLLQSSSSVLRCSQCGIDITGRVPFEYNSWQFCSTVCVRDHRSATKPHSS